MDDQWSSDLHWKLLNIFYTVFHSKSLKKIIPTHDYIDALKKNIIFL